MVSLETTFLIDLLRNERSAAARARALDAQGEPKVVAPPAAAEVLSKAYHLGEPALAKAREMLRSLTLLPMDWEACEEAGRLAAALQAQGAVLGAMDLLIAAITKRHGHRLLTRDRAYARVPGLITETY
jgi:predicted nucleic acid-binding protein